MTKLYINAEDFLLDSFKLAKKIYDSDFLPDKMVGLWRGGSLITLAIDEYFRFKGVKIRSYPLKVEAYSGTNLNKNVMIFGLNDLKEQIGNIEKLLLTDDIFDTGSSLEKTFNELKNLAKEIKIATIYYKPEKNKTGLKPNFYLHETNSWVVFPHELENLNLEEIKIKNFKIYELITT